MNENAINEWNIKIWCDVLNRDVPDSDFAGYRISCWLKQNRIAGYRISCSFLEPDSDIRLIA